jgi:hypothetical protein
MTSYLPDPLLQDVFALEPLTHVFAPDPLVHPEVTADPEIQLSVPAPERHVPIVFTPAMQSATVPLPRTQAGLDCGEMPPTQLLLAPLPSWQSV